MRKKREANFISLPFFYVKIILFGRTDVNRRPENKLCTLEVITLKVKLMDGMNGVNATTSFLQLKSFERLVIYMDSHLDS